MNYASVFTNAKHAEVRNTLQTLTEALGSDTPSTIHLNCAHHEYFYKYV